MFRKIIVGLFGVLLFAGHAGATCSWTTLANGTTADANQVMNDLNCLAPLANPSFTGNVGIGMENPTQKLTIQGSGSGDDQNVLQVRYTSSESYAANLGFNHLQLGNNGINYIVAGNTTGDGEIQFVVNNTNSLAQTAYIPNGITAMTIDRSGNVGIGTTTPSYTLQVNGTVAGASAYTNLSDERLKKDIHPIQNALQIIEQIHGVSFRWRTPAERSVGKKFDLPVDKPQIGFIAQDLEKVLPQAVSVGKGKDAIMTVAESKVVPVLVEAIKELKAANDKLAVANAKQADELHRLEIQVQKIQHHRTARAAVIQ